MDDSLYARRKRGDRWFLALVDPLLDKPEYFALSKDQVKIGFLSDCNWILPCDKMGLDVVADSLRLRRGYHPMAGLGVCSSWPNKQGPICERAKEPFFEMTFHPVPAEIDDKDEVSGCWAVSCPPGHNCRVGRVGDRDPRWSKKPNFGYADSGPESRLAGLKDGDVFEFVWPYWHFDADGVTENRTFHLPPQRLRFVFIEELAEVATPSALLADRHPQEDSTMRNNTKLSNTTMSFTSLPVEVLALIASHLSPSEFFDTLACVSRIFTSPAMKENIPWTKLTLENSFDSLRVPVMASPSSVRHIVCHKPWDKCQKYGIYLKWKKLLTQQDNVTTLVIHDSTLLCTLGVPPKIRRLSLVATDEHLGEFWSFLKYKRFPSSLEVVSVTCKSECYQEWTSNNQDSSDDDTSDSDDGDDMKPGRGLDLGAFFTSMRSLRKLRFSNVQFHDDTDLSRPPVPAEFVANVEHLAVDNVTNASFPLSVMKNLVSLEIAFAGSSGGLFNVVDFPPVPGPVPVPCFQQLRSLTVRNGYPSTVQPLASFLRTAPNLLSLKLVGRTQVSPVVILSLPCLLPQLKVLWVRHACVDLKALATLLKQHPSLLAVTILTCCGSAQGVTREAFLADAGEGESLRWEAWQDVDDKKWKFSFFFSRLTDVELQQVPQAILQQQQ